MSFEWSVNPLAINDSKKYYWLKLDRNFFKRHDIRIVETMPNGKDYILFYLKLLCESTSHEGCLRFSETIPYSPEMLATVTNTNVDVVRSAIKIFSELHMLEVLDDGTIFMQEVAKLVGSETGSARRMREYRNTQKMLTGDNGVQCHLEKEKEIEKDIEIDIDKEKDVPDTNVGNKRASSKNARVPSKRIYGNHKKVRLTDEELQKLKEKYQNADELIQHLDEYKEMTGKKYQSDYLAIKRWVVDAVKEKARKNNRPTQTPRRVAEMPSYMTERPKEQSSDETLELIRESYKLAVSFGMSEKAEAEKQRYFEMTGRDIAQEVGELKTLEE